MATKMADVHTNITSNNSGSQVIFHNPGQHPLPVGAGALLAPTVKSAGQPNGNARGQVSNTSVVFNNPA